MTPSNEPSLPEGVTHHAGPRQGEPSLGLDVVEIEYRMHGLELVIGWTVSPPNYFSAPDRLTIRPDGPLADFMVSDNPEMGLGEREMFNGVTTPLLRSIPMAHARHLLRRPYEELSSRLVRDLFMPMPDRVESDDDYVWVSCAYVDLVTGPSAEPIRRLSEWTGAKPATLSARLQRARAKGILVGRGRQAHISPAFKNSEQKLRTYLASRSGGHSAGTQSAESSATGEQGGSHGR